MLLDFVEGNEEFLESIYPIIEKAAGQDCQFIKDELKEKALWGSMRIIMAVDAREEVMAMGIATVNNQNTGHVEYILVEKSIVHTDLKKELQDRLEKWLTWLKVKSITSQPREFIY